ncbi:helix-turn-helix domain-containing protein [Mesorhizobium sp. M9A.F.Ca.ET.002.03.1.2]|uniref:GlxA family transcriptional regulator n=1 Tax=Mesorhizobium sp. M9A.F.Ca.ET.002.03.1.2 TaxID=2493668 RepID=UPI000F752C93|nr:helix-turn-helix domain-containing protein [Mesorhizobium sp. M9A.F.Ca.ET.002.03.1.2]AZN99229.1 helix-turn-helix domain-containing protein [Mesorhizobium sp. M9A.F.Ca.ET.002.03.1.2]
MNISVLALDGVFDTGLATVLDVFGTANELAVMLPATPCRFATTIVGVSETVCTAQGLQVPVTAIGSEPVPDWLVIPALSQKMPDPLREALLRVDIAEAVTALRAIANAGTRIGAACIGTFVLAETGLLDRRPSTTTWWLAPMFRQRYPQVRLDASRMLVNDGQFVTAGAALGHIDLALMVIRQTSPELAALTAKYLIVDSRPLQSAYAISDHLTHSNPLVERFERWARDHLATGFNLDEAAATLGASKRTLSRRVNDVLGKTPLSYFQDLRVEHAVHLLKTTSDSVEQIAAKVGYGDGVTLRNLLRRRLRKGVREIRAVN